MLENYIKYLIKFLTALVLLTVLVAFTITVRNNLEVKKNDTKITNDRKKVKIEILRALSLLIFPLEIGLFFLTGVFLSKS